MNISYTVNVLLFTAWFCFLNTIIYSLLLQFVYRYLVLCKSTTLSLSTYILLLLLILVPSNGITLFLAYMVDCISEGNDMADAEELASDIKGEETPVIFYSMGGPN